MPRLKTILVIHTTSNKANANSAADFSLEISRPGQDVTIPFPRNPNQRQQESSTSIRSTCRSMRWTRPVPAST